MLIDDKYIEFIKEFGEAKKMVLSTSLNDEVTSRMMSVILINNKFYFQTDKTFRKYNQIKNNKRVSLCIDNIQIEGECVEEGKPKENLVFCETYMKHFKTSFDRYTNLNEERLFSVTPTYIQRWLYINGIPYIEILNFKTNEYVLNKYYKE